MKTYLITQLVGVLVESLGPTLAKAALDALLDKAEEAIADSETKTDDALLLPIIAKIRDQFGLSDGMEA